MDPVEETFPNLPPSENYLVMLHDDVDLSSFKDGLPPNIRDKIISDWSIVKAKGIAGPFDEAARNFLSQHSDVKRIDGDCMVTAAARDQQNDAPSGLELSDDVESADSLDTSAETACDIDEIEDPAEYGSRAANFR